MSRTLLLDEQIAAWLVEHPDWLRSEGTVQLRDFPTAIALVVAVGDVAQGMDHHPDIDIRYDTVRFAVSTHSAGGLTALDLTLAQRIDELAQSLA